MSAQLKSLLDRNLSERRVPRYMRIVEDIKYRPAGITRASEIRRKSIVHFVEMHSGRINRLMEETSHFQVYIAKDLGQVSIYSGRCLDSFFIQYTHSTQQEEASFPLHDHSVHARLFVWFRGMFWCCVIRGLAETWTISDFPQVCSGVWLSLAQAVSVITAHGPGCPSHWLR
jgi:hypothetical protein